jgi:hypothetical protein
VRKKAALPISEGSAARLGGAKIGVYSPRRGRINIALRRTHRNPRWLFPNRCIGLRRDELGVWNCYYKPPGPITMRHGMDCFHDIHRPNHFNRVGLEQGRRWIAARQGYPSTARKSASTRSMRSTAVISP